MVKPIIVGGTLFAIAWQIILMGEVFATVDIYMMPEYFPVWSTLMMPDMGPPPAILYAISISVTFVFAFLYNAVYGILQNGIPGTGLRRGLNYGVLLFIISSLPSILWMWMLINLPPKFFIASLAFGIVHKLVGGVIIAWAFQRFGRISAGKRGHGNPYYFPEWRLSGYRVNRNKCRDY